MELIKTGALCEDAISTTAKALIDNDRELARRVKPIEREIDQKERDIESLCMKLLLQQQPVARDLRQISSALKMISDLERIGDQASDIAEILPYLQGSVSESKLHIKEMAQATIKMVTDSIESFVRRDLPLARSCLLYTSRLHNPVGSDSPHGHFFRQVGVKSAFITFQLFYRKILFHLYISSNSDPAPATLAGGRSCSFSAQFCSARRPTPAFLSFPAGFPE